MHGSELGFGNVVLARRLAEPLHFSAQRWRCCWSGSRLRWRFSSGACGRFCGQCSRAKKDAGFSLAPVGRRVWEFFSEVLCQSKVIRQRPLPGLAHAFVFWGFLAFALVTTNHVLTGLRLGVLQHTGARRRVLFLLRRRVGAAGGGVDCRTVCAAVFCAAELAGREGLD